MEEKRNPKVISVGSIKHGQGVTAIAFNLAYKLSSLVDKKILIVDINYLFKEMSYLAEQNNKNGIDDLISMVKTQDLTKDIFMLHTEELNKNLRVINSTQIETLDYIKKNDKYLLKVLEETKKYFDIIIVDASAGTKSSLTKELYEYSDVFVNVLTQNAYTIDWYVKHDEYKDEEKIVNVVNMYEEDIYPDYGDIKKEFKLENMVMIRYSKLFRHFYNQKILDPFYKTEDLFNNDFSQLIVKIGEKIELKELEKLNIVSDNMLIDVKYKQEREGIFSKLFRRLKK